jgi:hypothetical protein
LLPHILLLGDSIFDNGRYTLGAPDVISNLRKPLPSGWKSSLLALDASTTADISKQLEALPIDASHLVLSVGGNDAIMNAGILNTPAASAEALALLAEVAKKFEKAYRESLRRARVDFPLQYAQYTTAHFQIPITKS